ncbi:hypothetical protein KP509_27G069600 [Ceratopteris richardii]|uniref:Uncharacterized protein n=1 Tax=Ceratopteris richardii TaxID=49495 RepID=A0A8T2RJ75_CERRI|nr:hypothetical protein KP509_27G069600 [Ceratopteris richardii]
MPLKSTQPPKFQGPTPVTFDPLSLYSDPCLSLTLSKCCTCPTPLCLDLSDLVPAPLHSSAHSFPHSPLPLSFTLPGLTHVHPKSLQPTCGQKMSDPSPLFHSIKVACLPQ